MTDPADMDGAALGERVMEALGWVRGRIGMEFCWRDADGKLLLPISFTGPTRVRWQAFGVVAEYAESRDMWIELEVAAGEIRLHDGESGDALCAEVLGGIDDAPRALAVAFIRAASGEGRA